MTGQKQLSIQDRIFKLLKELGHDLYEREQTLAIALLAAIVGHNTFLYGPPGTAKSLISRRLSSAFKEPRYFEYLMNRFSTPEEVFGPVSIKELKEDRYIRQIEGYLPTADFAFLDEIWKSSPAILNNLLTIINEHLFKNGNERITVPLKSLIAASNEVPVENQGLDALYDRFIVRLCVPPVSDKQNFEKLISSKSSEERPKISEDLLISCDELNQWRERISYVKLSNDTLEIIHAIRYELAEQFDKLKVYVSDRRWQRAALLLKASAFCNGRTITNLSDTILLTHCLWITPENQKSVADLVMNAIEKHGFSTNIDLESLDKEQNSLNREINKELYYSENVYDIFEQNNELFFKATIKDRYNENYTLLIPYKQFKKKGEFHPLDKNGNQMIHFQCDFDGQGTCKIKSNRVYLSENKIFTPKILIKKGDKKSEINQRLIDSLAKSVVDVKKDLLKVLSDVKAKKETFQHQLKTPFVATEETNRALTSVLKQIEQLELRIKDCERLEALCN